MSLIDITRELMTTAPYDGDMTPRLHVLADHDRDGYRLSAAVMSLHAATHCDAPLHFLKDGADIASVDAEIFYGPCTVVSVGQGSLDATAFIRMHMQMTPRLLLRGQGVLLPSAVAYLYSQGVRLVGTDRSSIGTPGNEKAIHTALLEYGICILENLDLTNAPDGLYTLSALPLKIGGGEAAPCRAVLIR